MTMYRENILMNAHTQTWWVNMFIRLVSYFMLLIKFLFPVNIMELEKRLAKVENDLK
jgi:hypothetical protein